MSQGTATKSKAEAPAQEVALIEQMNAALADAWEQMGLFKSLSIQKATMIKLANLEGMPMTGIDVIKTQQGPRLYINNEGAKYNRDKYLASQRREVASRTIEVLDSMPGSNPENDKVQGRKYFKVTTRVKSPEYEKIVEGIASGKVNAEVGLKILEKIMEANTYTSYSAFSYQSENFSQNRTPEHILKKGQTQAHRRADLEISKQCVLPADEEPIDAEFTVKASAALDAAKESAAGGSPTLAPSGPAKVIDSAHPPKATGHVADAPKPGPAIEGKQTEQQKAENPDKIKLLIQELRNVFDQAGMSKFDSQKWMVDNGFPIKPKELTVAILEKAIASAKERFSKKPTSEAPAESKEDPAKKDILANIFGHREKALFESDDSLRSWVKAVWGKGLSEMSVDETVEVKDRVRKIADILLKHNKWGFSSPAQVMEFSNDSKGKTLHAMSQDELSKFESDLDETL